ncbi:unnamed protein product [Spirodela intermedia]|uniref:Uncharacterized protein n=1 Tax=Spirodela intermedia TaxID=51605 RepID=A0A7I8JQU9_SPIIN|nr:unnamed protein product [Spirodela intermedia]CAA6672557.1 unnamed protein product [Spirodela intermedia]
MMKKGLELFPSSGPASGSEVQSGSSREQGLERLAWIDRDTCAPLPFHITGGQPAVGQGVVVHLLFVVVQL